MLTRLAVFALALSLLTACATTGTHAGLIGTPPPRLSSRKPSSP